KELYTALRPVVARFNRPSSRKQIRYGHCFRRQCSALPNASKMSITGLERTIRCLVVFRQYIR
ncbi:hypothetical protein, partial [Clostridium phoceensis]|uniref:hypothetical protein n=1 Tax=Clostridium phoceensis TaxID=1650661 RepID=UPI0023F1665B